jgi:hypothetical protein
MANLYEMLTISLKNEQFFSLLKRQKAIAYKHKLYDFAEFEALVAK